MYKGAKSKQILPKANETKSPLAGLFFFFNLDI